MTLETLQQKMILAMKAGAKTEKEVISGLIAQIKTAAINEGCRDNITEEFVNKQILKAQKQALESIDGAKAAKRSELLKAYMNQYAIISEFAPQLITDEDEIRKIITNGLNDVIEDVPSITIAMVMKWLKTNYNGKIDMKIANKVTKELL